MDLTDENDYEKRLEQYKRAELMVEEYDIEITYLTAKLEGLNKNFFQINKSIQHYEKKYEETTMQSIEIGWKQNKANILLLTIKQYEAQFQEIKYEKEASIKASNLENLKKEIELLEINCSKNTETIKQLNEELSKITEEYVILKYKT